MHGVSSQRKLWGWLRAESPHLTLVAPDQRGRGDSADVAGPSSLGQHAADLAAVIDALGLDSVHVCGMSMGGCVAVEFAARYPSRVKSLVLVDGGVLVAPTAGLTRESVGAVFADRIARTQKHVDAVDEYVEFYANVAGELLDPVPRESTPPHVLKCLLYDRQRLPAYRWYTLSRTGCNAAQAISADTTHDPSNLTSTSPTEEPALTFFGTHRVPLQLGLPSSRAIPARIDAESTSSTNSARLTTTQPCPQP